MFLPNTVLDCSCNVNLLIVFITCFNLTWCTWYSIGDCWFLSALAVVAERPALIQRIFGASADGALRPEGVEQLQLCVDGWWTPVTIDTLLPAHALTHVLLYSQAKRRQLWVPLIEKAFAKLMGSFAALSSGRSIEGLATLTGEWSSFLLPAYRVRPHFLRSLFAREVSITHYSPQFLQNSTLKVRVPV